jgi:hypothetical protein
VNLRFVRRDSVTELEEEFPFESLMDFLPAAIENQVCLQDYFKCLNMDMTTIKEFLNL